MTADDTQVSEWERRGAEIAVGHLYLSLGNCTCGWSVALDGNPPSWKAQWAEHLMAAFRKAGLTATGRQESRIGYVDRLDLPPWIRFTFTPHTEWKQQTWEEFWDEHPRYRRMDESERREATS